MRVIGSRRGAHIRKWSAYLLAAGLTSGLLTEAGQADDRNAADAEGVVTSTSRFTATDGITYTATNHLTKAAGGPGREWLLAWTGPEDPVAPDFLAVIDATADSPTYGKVVNTVTMGPGKGNEPHHMQYSWHKGDRLYASGIMSDTTFVFDTSALPAVRLTGVNAPIDTPCGTLPDAYQVLDDGTAYASMLGGPNVAGPCTYSNGEVREGNGAAGSPGDIVRIGTDGRTLAEIPAAGKEGEDPEQCANRPVITKATCANPHGLALREDLDLLVASDFTESRSVPPPGQPLPEGGEKVARQSVRVFDISDRDNPRLRSVSKVQDGPRAAQEPHPAFGESRVLMETAITHHPEHKGAFVSSMSGGAVFYTPDITAPNPLWREIFDDTTAYRSYTSDPAITGGGDNSSWLAVSPDDRYLFHTVMGQSTPYGQPLDKTTGMVYVLDIQKLLAAGTGARCSVDELAEVTAGGAEADCPELAGAVPIRDTTDGGPHWGAMDNFAHDARGAYGETSNIKRFATSNYFIAGSFGGGGDHRVCMFTLGGGGKPAMDRTFRDERTGEPCINFNRPSWPHGPYGDARAHGVLFVVSDKVLW
jgi:hypothetical protein